MFSLSFIFFSFLNVRRRANQDGFAVGSHALHLLGVAMVLKAEDDRVVAGDKRKIAHRLDDLEIE